MGEQNLEVLFRIHKVVNLSLLNMIFACNRVLSAFNWETPLNESRNVSANTLCTNKDMAGLKEFYQ